MICKNLGGDISVVSKIGKGSTFTFTIKIFGDEEDLPTKSIEQPSKEKIQIESEHESLSDDEECRLVTLQDKDVFIQIEDEIVAPFNGLQFNLKESRANPTGNKEAQDLNQSLLQHLNELQKFELLGKTKTSGSIVFADDQYVNQQFMKISFEDFGLASKLQIYSNGNEAVDYFTNLLKNPHRFSSS